MDHGNRRLESWKRSVLTLTTFKQRKGIHTGETADIYTTQQTLR